MMRMILSLLLVLAAPQSANQRMAEHYLEEGRIQFTTEMYAYAIFSFKRALETDPGCYEAANYLGEIHLLKKDKIKALENFDHSLRIKEDQPDILCKAGELHEFFLDLDRAFAYYRKAVSLREDHVRANLHLVRFYLKKGERELAKRHFTASYESGLKQSEQLFFTAQLEDRSGNHDMAMKFYEDALAANPAHLAAYFGIYEIYRKKNRPDLAIATMERLIFFKPDDERAHINLGHLYFDSRLGGKRLFHIGKAIQHLRAALALNPRNAETCLKLAEIYDFKGELEKAREMEQRAFELEKEAKTR